MTIDIEKVVDDATKRVLNLGDQMVVVRNDVPMPPKTVGRKSESKYASLRLLRVGDHFTVSTQKEVNRILCHQKKLGMKFSQRKMPDGTIGIWVTGKDHR